MKIESQVASLELCKKLKELGVKQESLWNWLEASDGARLMRNPVPGTYKYFDQCSAFTVAELGEMLPAVIRVSNKGKSTDFATLDMQKYEMSTSFGVLYCENGETIACYKDYQIEEYADTEADARVKMLIYLLENKLMTVTV